MNFIPTYNESWIPIIKSYRPYLPKNDSNIITLAKHQSLYSCVEGYSVLEKYAEIKVPPDRHKLRVLNPYNIEGPPWVFIKRRGIMPDGEIEWCWQQTR